MKKSWSARSCNYMPGALSQVLAQLVAEGRLARNVATLVDRVPGKARKFETFTADQVRAVLGGIAKDRNRHAWHLAQTGLRRGEIAGLRWDDVDSNSGQYDSARPVSTLAVAHSTKTTRRQRQLAACSRYLMRCSASSPRRKRAKRRKAVPRRGLRGPGLRHL
jgi:integrase